MSRIKKHIQDFQGRSKPCKICSLDKAVVAELNRDILEWVQLRKRGKQGDTTWNSVCKFLCKEYGFQTTPPTLTRHLNRCLGKELPKD